ncbi:MAG: hypothetical protein ABJA78_19845 [Ferruginibacter sp.]
MKKYLLTIALSAAVLIMTSCTGTYVVSSQPVRPNYVRPMAPGNGYIWIEGDWAYEGGNYRWHEGHWGRPRGHRNWQPGSWHQTNRGWSWQKGRWR